MTELTLEVGKYYRTRDGRKVGPMRKPGKTGWIEWVEFISHLDCVAQGWSKHGRAAMLSHMEAPEDLVAEWVDEPEEDEVLKSLADERSDGPFVSVDLDDLTDPKPWGDDDGWSEWTSDADWDVNKVDVQMECIDGIHRTRTRPRNPKRETVTIGWDIHDGASNDVQDVDTHRITFDTIDGVPDCSTVRMEEV